MAARMLSPRPSWTAYACDNKSRPDCGGVKNYPNRYYQQPRQRPYNDKTTRCQEM